MQRAVSPATVDIRWHEALLHPAVVLILGKRGSGKSALAYRLLELFQLADTDQIPMMAAIDARGEKLVDVTKAWVDANQGKWKPWVDAALKGN